MSDAGVSSVILVIVTLLVATTIGGAFIQISDTSSQKLEESSKNTAEKISGDIQILSSSDFVFEGDSITNTTTIVVKNTGDVTISATSDNQGNFPEIDTFINGRFQQPDSAQVREGNMNVWAPSQTIEIEYVDSTSINCFEENRFNIIVKGNEDDLVFYADCS